jgi:hypothetical protein
VREPEGIETPPPGKSSERPWSKRQEPDIRNVEAVGSNPITSTKKAQVNGLTVGVPQRHHPGKRGRVSLSVFTGNFPAANSVEFGHAVDEVHHG